MKGLFRLPPWQSFSLQLVLPFGPYRPLCSISLAFNSLMVLLKLSEYSLSRSNIR